MKTENKKAIQKELQELGSALNAPGKEAGFKVPEGYFDELPGKIQGRLEGSTNIVQFRKPVASSRQVFAWAASLLILVALGISLFLMRSDNDIDYVALDEQYIDFEYLQAQAYFDQDMIYQLIMDSDISAEEILYNMDADILADDEFDYDEIMEMILEEARYFGIESEYLLSSLY